MVCLRNICINTVHKGGNDDDDNDDDDNDNNNDNNNNVNDNNNNNFSVGKDFSLSMKPCNNHLLVMCGNLTCEVLQIFIMRPRCKLHVILQILQKTGKLAKRTAVSVGSVSLLNGL